MQSATVLPDTVTAALAESAYMRARFAQRCVLERRRNAQDVRLWAAKAVRAAKGKDRFLLNFLEQAAERLRILNDDQKARLSAQDLQRQDFVEFSLWKEAYVLATRNAEAEGASLEIFQYIYGAAYEAATRGRVWTEDRFLT